MPYFGRIGYNKLPVRSVLLIGISESHRALFASVLEDFSIYFSTSFEESLPVLQREDPVIFIDDPKEEILSCVQKIRDIKTNLSIILILKEGDEKTAVAAVQAGVSDYLTHGELIPAIIRMTVTRALEHKKWENIYRSLAQANSAASLKDPVTGLYNKVYFETRLIEEVKRSERYTFPLTTILFAMEQFDFIAGKYGVETADALLKELSALLLKDLRGSDLMARVGPDRFAMLLPHTSVNQALMAWERLLQTVAEHPFSLKGDNFYISLKGVLTPLNREVEHIDNLLQKLEEDLRQNASSDESLRLYLET